jgi:hypothetical protein
MTLSAHISTDGGMVKAEKVGSPTVDDQFEPRGLLHLQVRRVGPVKDLMSTLIPLRLGSEVATTTPYAVPLKPSSGGASEKRPVAGRWC